MAAISSSAMEVYQLVAGGEAYRAAREIHDTKGAASETALRAAGFLSPAAQLFVGEDGTPRAYHAYPKIWLTAHMRNGDLPEIYLCVPCDYKGAHSAPKDAVRIAAPWRVENRLTAQGWDALKISDYAPPMAGIATPDDFDAAKHRATCEYGSSKNAAYFIAANDAKPDDPAGAKPWARELMAKTILVYEYPRGVESDFCPPGAVKMDKKLYAWLSRDAEDRAAGIAPPPMPAHLQKIFATQFLGLGEEPARPAPAAAAGALLTAEK